MAARFVAATDEVWRLQTGSSPECKLFQAIANQGHYRDPGGTRQGIYVCSPSGRLLASINSLDPREVGATMEAGLAVWAKLPEAERGPSPAIAAARDRRWEANAPKDGLILASVRRDLGLPPIPASPRSDRWNLDHAWFSKSEARQWLSAEPTLGSRHRIPDALTQRVVRFHLIDNVRGQCLPFAATDAIGSTLETEVTARESSTVVISITGHSRAESSDAWDMSTQVWKPEPQHRRGLTSRLLGRAAYDLNSGSFTRFELIALGERWGYSENNARGPDSAPSPIGFYFTLPAGDTAPAIPPAFIDVYNAEWLVPPDRK